MSRTHKKIVILLRVEKNFFNTRQQSKYLIGNQLVKICFKLRLNLLLLEVYFDLIAF